MLLAACRGEGLRRAKCPFESNFTKCSQVKRKTFPGVSPRSAFSHRRPKNGGIFKLMAGDKCLIRLSGNDKTGQYIFSAEQRLRAFLADPFSSHLLMASANEDDD